MKNILTSAFDSMLHNIQWLNKTKLIRICLLIDFSLNIDYLKTFKNHELRYIIISRSIDNIDLILDINKEYQKMWDEQLWRSILEILSLSEKWLQL